MSIQAIMELIEENEVRFIDLRFTDTKGKKSSTVTIPVSQIDVRLFRRRQNVRWLIDCRSGKA